MLEIGAYNQLEIVKTVDFGVYLDGGPFGEILLPQSNVTSEMEVGNEIRVFLYTDSEDRLIATTISPKAICGEFAFLKVKEIASPGAFLDWGLSGKDLLVPYREQFEEMEVGQSYLVYIYLDEKTERIVASSRLNRYVKSQNDDYEAGQEVNIFIARRMPKGFRAIIDDRYWGVLYDNEIFQKIAIGDQIKAFIKNIREDNLIDLSLQKQGYTEQMPLISRQILEKLEQENGFLPLTDKSSPEAIYSMFQMSKKNFKKAIGGLYKRRMISIQANGIVLENTKK